MFVARHSTGITRDHNEHMVIAGPGSKISEAAEAEVVNRGSWWFDVPQSVGNFISSVPNSLFLLLHESKDVSDRCKISTAEVIECFSM